MQAKIFVILKRQLVILADGEQALLNCVALGLGERAALGEPVDGVQGRVDECGVVLRARKVRGAAGQQRQHRRAYVSVHGQRCLCGAQCLLQVEAQNKIMESGQATCL